MKQNVLIMGGSYFIGKKIVDVFLENEYNVFTLNRGTKQSTDYRIVNLICDRNDIQKMQRVLGNYNFDNIIDVSGLNKMQAEILYSSINTQKLKTFVFISSSAVYDVENLNAPYCENDKLAENKYWALYGKNKIDCEQFYTQEFSKINSKLIILRPPYVYGENNYAERESFIFNHIIEDKPIIIPNADTKLQFIYTADLANIILKLISTNNQKNLVLNVGNKQAVSIKEWIEYCEKIVGKKAKIIEYDYKANGRSVRDFFPFYDYHNVLDVKKINEIYNIETDFSVGLQAAYNWYLNNKDNIEFKPRVTENEKNILAKLNIN